MTTSSGANHIIISSDTHAGADLREYKPYLASKWHDEFDAWADAYSSPWDDLVNDTADRNWDSDLRLQQTQADGVVAEVLFPNTIPPFFPSISNIVPLPKDDTDYQRRWAGIQAHNRWLVDFCSKAPDQRRGLVQVFPHKVDDAVAEIKWAGWSSLPRRPTIRWSSRCSPTRTSRCGKRSRNPIWPSVRTPAVVSPSTRTIRPAPR
ncbi:MAG TPA: hypothetical protein PLV68_03115 [Ilumatobacteraceae bacterium]|nr:hypothetical protein [Ilumatobacteraceae bacterium]